MLLSSVFVLSLREQKKSNRGKSVRARWGVSVLRGGEGWSYVYIVFKSLGIEEREAQKRTRTSGVLGLQRGGCFRG